MERTLTKYIIKDLANIVKEYCHCNVCGELSAPFTWKICGHETKYQILVSNRREEVIHVHTVKDISKPIVYLHNNNKRKRITTRETISVLPARKRRRYN